MLTLRLRQSEADAAAPYWPRVVEDVTAAMRRLDPDRSVLLVAHSNAGLFVPCSSPIPTGP